MPATAATASARAARVSRTAATGYSSSFLASSSALIAEMTAPPEGEQHLHALPALQLAQNHRSGYR
jgi:hypothetical protein